MQTYQERWEKLSEIEKARFFDLEAAAYKSGEEVEQLERALETRRRAATMNKKAAKQNYYGAAIIFIVIMLLFEQLEFEPTRLIVPICLAGSLLVMGARNEIIELIEARNADEIANRLHVIKYSRIVMPFSYVGEGGEELRSARKKVYDRLLNISRRDFYSLWEFDD